MAHNGNLPGWYPPQNIKMLYKLGEILKISDNASTFEYDHVPVGGEADTHINSMILTIQKPNGEKIINQFSYGPNKEGYINREYSITLNESGEYKIFLSIDWHNAGDFLSENYSKNFSTYVYVNPENSALKPYTLGDTIRRLLALTPLHRAGEFDKYRFDSEQLKEFDNEESPEFAFTGHTLFEALLIIAQYKGSFPVLKDSTISFRKLWNGKRLKESDLPPPIEEISCSDINQYCTYLETEVQNLVGVNDSQAGSIIEPYAGGYKTVRAASGSEISQDTAVISTDYNLYQHIKQEVGYIDSTLPAENDITAYVYESGDYYALTDKSAAYPASKAYALQWQQMGQNVAELTHRVKTVGQLANAFTAPAIANIIQAKTGLFYNGDNVVGFIQKMIDEITDKGEHTLEHSSTADLMFRTTYIPVVNARIKQYKDYYGDFHYDGSLKYNQTAELVDSELYGEHLKQLIRKLGNVTKRKIYIFDKIDDVPEVGTVIDGYSVYDVQMSIRENEVVATISYVKYAELSNYIGVKNPWKDSDVSIDKCYNRQISYNEFLLFTHDKNKVSTSEAVSETALNNLLPKTESAPLTCVQGTGYTEEGEPLNTVFLPVVSLAMGNSLYFQWSYKNNYSAGYMSEEAPPDATSLLSGTRYNRTQKAVKYADMYGKLETYDFILMPTGPTSENIDKVEINGESITDKSLIARYIGYSLPLKPDGMEWNGVSYISVDKLLVEKNSSEALTFSVQMHYCADNENFIIGSGLTNFCPLIGGSAKNLILYGFKERINIFDRHLSVADARQLSKPKIETANGKISFMLPPEINDYAAWAYVGIDNKNNYQIIFGENKDLENNVFNPNLFILPIKKVEDVIK